MSTWISNSTVKQKQQSIENNTSTITATLKVNWNFYSWADDSPNWYIEIYKNGTRIERRSGTANFNSSGDYSSGEQVITTQECIIPHDNDGTCVITWKMGYEAQHKGEGYETTSGSLNLTPILRASNFTVSVTQVALGGTVGISIQPYSENFSHKVYYSINNSGKQAIDTSSTTGTRTISWVTTSNIATYLPTSTSGICSIIVETYSGSTLIGSKNTSITLTVPNTAPYISGTATFNYSEANTSITNSGLDKTKFYKGKSALNCSCSIVPGLGTSIANYSTVVTYNGASATETFSGNSFITSTIPANTTSISFVTTFTDARGRTSQKTTTISSELSAYTNLSISSISASPNDELEFEGYSSTPLYCADSTWTPLITGSTGATYKADWYMRYRSLGSSGDYTVSDIIYSTSTYGNNAHNQLQYNVLNLNIPLESEYQYGLRVTDGISTSSIVWGTTSYCIKGLISNFDVYNRHSNSDVAGSSSNHFYNKIRVYYGTDTLITGVKETYYINSNSKINLTADSSHFVEGDGYIDLTFNNTSVLTPNTSYNIYVVFNTEVASYTKTITFSRIQTPSIGLSSFGSSKNLINYYDSSWDLYFYVVSYLTENNHAAYDFDYEDISEGFKFFLNGTEIQIPSSIIGEAAYQDERYQWPISNNGSFYNTATNPLSLNLNGSNNIIITVQATNVFGKIVGTANYSVTLDFFMNPTVIFRQVDSAYLYLYNGEQVFPITNTELRESMELYFYASFTSYNSRTHSVKMQIARLTSGTPTDSDWVDFYSGVSFSEVLQMASGVTPSTKNDVIGPIVVREINKNYNYYFRIVIDNSVYSSYIGAYTSIVHTNSTLDISEVKYDTDTEDLTIDLIGSTLGYSTNVIPYANTSKVDLLYGVDSTLTNPQVISTTITDATIYSSFIVTENYNQKIYTSFPSDWTHNYFQFKTESTITKTYGSVAITTIHTSYSKIALAYNQAPTVAYRPNFLGINNNINATIDTTTVLAIHDYGDRKNINLISAEKTSTINLLDGSLENFIIDGGSWD